MDLELARHDLTTLLKRLLDHLHLLQDPGGVLRQKMAFVRELQAPGGALGQPDAEAGLQLPQPLGHGRRRDVLFPGQGRQATQAVQRQDEPQILDVQLHS
ncbi:hypothetical protein D3C71_1875430 [compost metagenome]